MGGTRPGRRVIYYTFREQKSRLTKAYRWKGNKRRREGRKGGKREVKS